MIVFSRVLVIMMFAFPCRAWATDGATVSGRVTDAQGQPVARVDLVLTGTPGSRHAASDADGRFAFTMVPPGIYEVRASARGFSDLRSELAALECGHIQQCDGRWVFVDLILGGPAPNYAADLEQIQFLLGHASIQTTARYLGSRQNLKEAVTLHWKRRFWG